MAKTAFILILPSDETKGRRLNDLLRIKHGHSCRVETTLEAAMESIRARIPDVVVAVDKIDGKETLPSLAELLASLAPDATLLGVADGAPPRSPNERVHFIGMRNPEDDTELVDPIGRAATEAVARRDDRLMRQSVAATRIEPFEGLVGVSPAIQRIIRSIRRAARNKLTVLILGETGVGKEIIARAIHNQSDRAHKPFRSLNCAGMSETLIESELFGHTRGAFTGAVADRKGYFAAADGGTLFLDEIGDMPYTMQSKLLRVLEHREITPVGSTDVLRVDVRVIAATNADLQQKIREKTFREDLYYRLHQWEIRVAPLRERREDIPVLVHHMLEIANREQGASVPGLSSDALAVLTKHHWPGNVRELRNVIERAVAEVEDRRIEVDDLPEALRGTRDLAPIQNNNLVGLTMDEIERLAITAALQATGGNRDQAAKMLNIGVRTLYRKIKEFALESHADAPA